MFKTIIRLALRNLVKQKQTTLIGIVGLIIGYSVFLQIANWGAYELSYDKHQSKYDRIYRFTVEENRPEENFYWHFARCWQTWRTKLPDYYSDIETLTELRPLYQTAVKNDINSFSPSNAFAVDSTIFNIFDFNFVEGDASSCLLAKGSAIVSESFAKKLFPNDIALNKKISLPEYSSDNKGEFTITGIFKEIPKNSHFHTDLLVKYEEGMITGNDFAYTYLLLKEGADIKQVKKRETEFITLHVPENQQNGIRLFFTPLGDIHLKSHIEREIELNGDIRQVKLLNTISIGILIVSLFNFLNLQFASISKRNKFFSINLAIGGSGMHNVWLLFIESLIISIAVIIPSFFLFRIISSILVSSGIITSIQLQLKTPIQITLLFVGLVLATGTIPALIVRIKSLAFGVNKAMLIPLNHKLTRINYPLLLLQFAISVVVIIGSLMLNKQNRFLFSKNLGNENRNIISVDRAFWAEESQAVLFKDQLLKEPGVLEVSSSMDPPGYLVKDARRIEYADIPAENKNQLVTILPVDANFFSFFNIPLIAGSEVEYIPGQEFENYILNESAIELLGYSSPEEAIGSSFKLEAFLGVIQGGKIVGVVKDFNFTSLYSPIEPTVFFSKPIWQGTYLIKLAGGNLQEQIASVEHIWNDCYPDYPFEYNFLDDIYEGYYQRDIITNKIVTIISIISIVLSSIGLLGISSILILGKTKEIGIRKVNGAKISEVLIFLNQGFIKWIFIAIVIAIPLAFSLVNSWLENFAYRTTIDWWIFILAGSISLIIALITVSWQSWRAATRNPVDALRYE